MRAGPIIALALAVALAGCVSLGAKAPKTLITLTAATTVTLETTRSAAPGETIMFLTPSAPAAIATARVPVYDGNRPLTYVAGVAWNEPPVRLFQRLLGEIVAAKTGKIVVDLRQAGLDGGMRVSGQLLNFGIDAPSRQAVVTYDGLITRNGGTIETRRFEARVPVGKIDALTVGEPLNRAANTVATQVAAWIGG